jgi:hypothetical protein
MKKAVNEILLIQFSVHQLALCRCMHCITVYYTHIISRRVTYHINKFTEFIVQFISY